MDLPTQEAVRRGMTAQLGRLRAALAHGTPRLGWKIAVNDPAVQRHLGLDGPLVAALDGSARLASGETYRPTPTARLAAEAEIAISIRHDLPADSDLAVARASIASLAPAIELVDRARPAGDLATLLEHSVFHAATVIGPPKTDVHGAPPGWPQLTIAGRPPLGPDPSLIPTDLATLVLHVARTLAAHGDHLTAGDIIISGSFVQPVPIAPGDHVTVDFGPLGTVAVTIGATST